jgi:hypothetical protein
MLVLAALGLIAMNWVNYAVSTRYPSGEYFSVLWTSGRAFLQDGSSPYSEDVTAQIQRSSVEHGYPVDPTLQRFSYPLYIYGLIFPFILVSDFTAAQVAWMTVLELALLLIAFFSIRVTSWRVSYSMGVLVGAFILFNYISVSQVYQGSIMIVVSLLVVLTLAALQKDLDEVAGILLALVTIKPSPAILFVVFVLFWAASNRRWKLVFWAAGGWVLVAAGGMFFQPDWPLQYLRLLLHSTPFVYFQSPGAAFQGAFPGLGKQLGWVLSGLLGLILLLEWWLVRKRDFRWFLWTACLTLSLTPWIGLPTEPGFQVLLLLPLVLVFSKLEEHWDLKARSFVITVMILVFAGLWLLFGWDLPDTLVTRKYPALYFPLPLLSIIGLYWVKWWAIKPRRTFISELRAREEF